MKRVIQLRKEKGRFNNDDGSACYTWLDPSRQIYLCHNELNKYYHLPRNGKLFLCISTKPVRGAWHLTVDWNYYGNPRVSGLPDDTWILSSVDDWFVNNIAPAQEAWAWFENG